MKRSRDEEDVFPSQQKRTRLDSSKTDRLSILSHELLLRILSSLTVADLAICQRVSQHFQDLSCDSQLWKEHYYNRFVRPRAARIPGVRNNGGDTSSHLHFSSKLSKWLDEDTLVRRGRETDWRRQYKLRHNWAQGTCSVSEITVSEEIPVPPLLVAMLDSTIFLADGADGLRAWNASAGHVALAKISWDKVPAHDAQSPPSALAVDASKDETRAAKTLVAVGFQDGSFCVFELDNAMGHFRLAYRHAASSNGMLSAVAISFPHLATMTANQLLSVYAFPQPGTDDTPSPTLPSPSLIHSLHSSSVLPPLTLSIRPTPSSTIISTAYSLPTYLSGFTLGIQELHLDPTDNSVMHSRLTSSPSTSSLSAPTSLSYSHPYLLASHPDNTISLYLVSSTATLLRIATPVRLWGHTSAVSGTAIGRAGRAVSVSRGADDVRLWDLEDRVAPALRRGNVHGVRVVAANREGQKEEKPKIRQWGRAGMVPCLDEDVCLSRGWVGFDEENVVLLKETAGAGQSLVVYDFA
ncbi:hypothetical protein ANO11243_016180 [Dothideomycetidae sp. 11243]|nr:hypothetical protein ANO11243_016180 [fungal sp. No.11243]